MVRNPALPETFCREEVMEAGAGEVPVDGFVFGGIVVKGNQLGRTIGFPTANLETATVLPAGVFACRVKILENASGQGKPEEPGSPDISGRSQSCPKRLEGLESTLDSRSPASPGCPPEGGSPGKPASPKVYGAMLNVGTRPTVSNTSAISIEVNLFGFSGNLYGRYLQVELVKRIRNEKKFNSLAELQAQLSTDKRQVQALLAQC